MYLRLLLVVVVMLSFGCAHVSNDKAVLPNDMAKSQQLDEQKNDVTVDEKIEPSQLDSALLYSLLGGEIAGQRGKVEMASAFYVDAAERSRDPQIALRAAQIALYNKDIVAAKSAIDILLEDGRLSAQAYRLALTIYLRSGDVPKSLAQIDYLLEETSIPKRNALLSVGDIVRRNASKAVAVEVMEHLIVDYPEESGVYLAHSQIMAHVGELESALNSARKAVEIGPLWATGYVQLALVLENKGDSEQALATLKESSERLQAKQLVMGYGQLLAKHEHYLEAKEQFLNLATSEKDYPEARFALGFVYLKLNDAKNSKEVFENLHKEGRFPSKAAFYLGRINYHQKEYKEALKWFSEVDRGVNYVESQANMAMIKSETNDLQGARSILQTLRLDSPKSATRFYLLEAELLMNGQHNKEAYLLLTKAVEESPADLALRYTRSIAATEVDDIAMAEKDLLHVLQATPKDANALNALGYTLASKTFRFKEARQYLTEALSLRPNDSAILDSMGWLNYREGKYEKALILLEKAYDITPGGEIAAHLGEVLWVLGRQKEAKVVWEQALKRDADNRYLIEVLLRLK